MLGTILVFLIGLAVAAIGALAGKIFSDTMGMTTAQKVRRGVGLAVAVLGGWIAVGAFLEGPPVEGTDLNWQTEAQYEQALASAKDQGKPVMIDFWTESCTNCKVMEKKTFKHPEVAPILQAEFVLIKLNTNILYDDYKPLYDQLTARYGNIETQPYVVFLNGEGEFLKQFSFNGLKEKEDFAPILPQVKDASAEGGGGGLAGQIANEGLAVVLLLIFLGGIGASLTPCVYPLIPITVAVFGARTAQSRLQAFGLSCVYVSGMVVFFVAMGLIAASVGRGIGALMNNPWVLGSLAIMFIVMGLGSFGLFEMKLPSSVQNKLSQAGGKGIGGAFVMGLVAGLVATPCVGPILVSVLVFVAQSQDLLLGAVLLAVFALGMGLLFLVIGTFAGMLTRLPRSGPWMLGVKTVFGIVFIVVAFYYLKNAVPALKAPIYAAWKLAAMVG
jgi:thiol:disulfide interchange protein